MLIDLIIQQKYDNLITSDGSKIESKSEGAWLIADLLGNRSISGPNPDFGNITSMNSHWSKIYGMLSALLFLHEYCQYLMTPLTSNVNYFCDNLEVVNKMKQLMKDEQYYDECIKTVDHDAVYLLNQYLSQQFNITHVRSHQDKSKQAFKLTTVEKLNIAADEVVGITSGGIYQPNRYKNKIRSSSGVREACEFMQGKYYWTGRLIDSIE